MLEIISEWATIYFKVGAILAFGLGAVAQIIQGKSRDWTLTTSLVLTLFWPYLLWDAIFRR